MVKMPAYLLSKQTLTVTISPIRPIIIQKNHFKQFRADDLLFVSYVRFVFVSNATESSFSTITVSVLIIDRES